MDKAQIIEAIKAMNVLELSELVKELEDVFGVSAAAPVAVAAASTVAAAPEVEEKTEFNVVLAEIGADKIKVIRVVRETHRPGPEGSKGPCGRSPQHHQGRRHQGRSRQPQSQDRRSRREDPA